MRGRSSRLQHVLSHQTIEDFFRQVALLRKMISHARDICRPRSVRVSVIRKHDHAAGIWMPKHPVVIGD